MRLASGVTDQYIYFVAVDATDLKTRETGLSSWTVYRSRNGGASAAMTTPTINETDATNMPGVYELLLDEDTTIDAGDVEQEMVYHITHAGMAPVTRTITIFRPDVTAGETLTVASGVASANTTQISGDATAADNAESFFDGTGYAGTNNVIPTVTAVTNQVTANVTAISGDATAADNLEAAADGTGYNLGGGSVVAASVTGAVGSVTGAVGSVTGNVGGNVTGTIGGLAAGALADMFDTDSGTTFASAVAGSVVKEIADNVAGGSLTEAGIADAVWDEAIAGHAGAGSTGETLAAAGAIGDPWSTALPGAYAAGTAGQIVGDLLDVAVSSVASSQRPIKNTALSGFMFPMFDAVTKSPKTGLTVTASRSIDGNAFGSCANAVVELGNGVYRINLDATDLNGDKIMLRFVATGADVQLVELFTQG